jgi:carbamoyl-phosphate synthase large subunit
MNLCLTSAGRRVELARTFYVDAKSLGVSLTILGLDSDAKSSAACQFVDDFETVPPVSSSQYLKSLFQICTNRKIGLIVPTIDTELLMLAEARDELIARGVKAMVSTPATIAIARDKFKTAEVLASHGIPSPRTVLLEQVISGRREMSGPLVLKRIDGSRSIGLHFIDKATEAKDLNLDVNSYVAQERCFGPEYTVNCYVDQSGKLRTAVPHRRIETRSGEVSKGVTERRTDLHQLAKQIVEALPGLRGPFCFQAILTKEGPVVFEINARFGGGYPLAHASGATFGKWILEEALGMPCSAHDDWQDGLLMLRYDAAVFVKPAIQ